MESKNSFQFAMIVGIAVFFLGNISFSTLQFLFVIKNELLLFSCLFIHIEILLCSKILFSSLIHTQIMHKIPLWVAFNTQKASVTADSFTIFPAFRDCRKHLINLLFFYFFIVVMTCLRKNATILFFYVFWMFKIEVT